MTLGVNVRIVPAPPNATQRPRGDKPAALVACAERGRSVRLWRDADGTARMTCPHAVRHSPSGPEWGYLGSGPADCARSVLLALTDEATAEAHYQAFEADVIARLPEPGAVLQRTAVLAWLSGQTAPAGRSLAA